MNCNSSLNIKKSNYFTNNGAVWLSLTGSDLEKMIRKIIAYNRLDLDDKNVLDLGCGTGTMLQYAVENYQWNASGVDLIRLNIHQAKKKVPSGNFYRGDILSYLNDLNEKFDLVILYGVIGCFTIPDQKMIIDKIESNRVVI